jgi:hypothetical protein
MWTWQPRATVLNTAHRPGPGAPEFGPGHLQPPDPQHSATTAAETTRRHNVDDPAPTTLIAVSGHRLHRRDGRMLPTLPR